jgi:hypothetical protein
VKLTASGAWTVNQYVYVTGLVGTTEGNGAWQVSATDGSTYIVLSGSAYANAYVSGGTIYAPTLATFTADVNGTGSNALANTVTHPITSLIGVSVSNVGPWLGQNIEGNASVAKRCGLKLQAISPNGPSGAYLYMALTAITLAPTLSPPQTLSSAIISAVNTSSAGQVTVTMANSGGVVSANDVAVVDAVFQAYCVPISVTVTPQSCTTLGVTVVVTIYVPKANVAAALPVVQVAVAAYILAVPVGGLNDPGGASNVVPIQGFNAAISAACSTASIPVQDIASTLNGSASNLAVGTTQKPLFSNAATFVPTVVGY